MPKCPRCGEHFSFEEIGIYDILEGEDAEAFLKEESATPEQVAMFKGAIKIYRDHVKSDRFMLGGCDA